MAWSGNLRRCYLATEQESSNAVLECPLLGKQAELFLCNAFLWLIKFSNKETTTVLLQGCSWKNPGISHGKRIKTKIKDTKEDRGREKANMRRGRGAGQRKGNHLHHRLDPRFQDLWEIIPQHGQWNYRYYFIPQCSCCCSVTKSCLTLHDPMDCSTRGFPVPHHLPEFSQVHVHCISDAIQPSISSSVPLSPPAFNLSQDQCLFQWVSSLRQVAKVLEFQLQHQSFQWIFRVDFL